MPVAVSHCCSLQHPCEIGAGPPPIERENRPAFVAASQDYYIIVGPGRGSCSFVWPLTSAICLSQLFTGPARPEINGRCQNWPPLGGLVARVVCWPEHERCNWCMCWLSRASLPRRRATTSTTTSIFWLLVAEADANCAPLCIPLPPPHSPAHPCSHCNCSRRCYLLLLLCDENVTS